jgi:hypothetical protein
MRLPMLSAPMNSPTFLSGFPMGLLKNSSSKYDSFSLNSTLVSSLDLDIPSLDLDVLLLYLDVLLLDLNVPSLGSGGSLRGFP